MAWVEKVLAKFSLSFLPDFGLPSLDMLTVAASSLDCISSIPIRRHKNRSCQACNKLRTWTPLDPEHIEVVRHEGCLSVGPDLAQSSSKAQELQSGPDSVRAWTT